MDKLLKEKELAERWGISPRTLEGLRYRDKNVAVQLMKGPLWLVLAGSVRYRLSDVISYEQLALNTLLSPKLATSRNASKLWRPFAVPMIGNVSGELIAPLNRLSTVKPIAPAELANIDKIRNHEDR